MRSERIGKYWKGGFGFLNFDGDIIVCIYIYIIYIYICVCVCVRV